MDPAQFQRIEADRWQVAPRGDMRVPAIIFADEPLIEEMDQKVFEQLTNVATLPGIVKAAYAMPDAHWGYGFPIGGVAAFDAAQGGVVSAGGVGFDVSCGCGGTKVFKNWDLRGFGGIGRDLHREINGLISPGSSGEAEQKSL